MAFRTTLKSFNEADLEKRIAELTSRGWRLIRRGKEVRHVMAEQIISYWGVMEEPNDTRLLRKL